ncbi:hypothetical protein Q8G35_16075 [Peribacillus simplex]|uniref:Uncharacterized protein n=2 Tax=Peribacillus TaxID=2675229 RepID=A0AA90SL63_9BACI|nr:MULTISPECIES: hypothetical protein [Peribacillus]MDP1419866.1 hypothetical protein [Peribacillus simplex]MDP1452726.1 hypothetical protein [Peribacillus frigoritolerans]
MNKKIYDLLELDGFEHNKDTQQYTEEILNRMRNDFIVEFRKNYNSDLLSSLSVSPLIIEIENYYNNDVCIFAAIFLSKYEKNNNSKINAYHLENVVIRICSCWEYLFILVNAYLNLDMVVGRDLLNKIMESSKYEVKFKESGGKIEPVFQEYSIEISEERKNKLKKRIKLFNLSSKSKSNSFHKKMKKTYSNNEKFKHIFDLYYSEPVKEFISIRNEFVHRRTLGAKFSYGPIGIGLTQGINSNPNGWFSFKGIELKIEENIVALSHAIKQLKEIIYNGYRPNLKINEGKVFWGYEIHCEKCEKEIVLADFIVDLYSDISEKPVCPNCLEKQLIITDKLEMSDYDYHNNFKKYLGFLSELKEM